MTKKPFLNAMKTIGKDAMKTIGKDAIKKKKKKH